MKTIKLKTTAELRKYTKYEPPQPRNKDLPPTYNIILSASNKGSGKTYNIVQLLTNYEESGFVSENGEDVVMRSIWISGGTSRSKQNSILDSLKSLDDEDRIDVDTNIDKKINEIYDSILLEKQEIELYQIYIKTYNKFIKLKDLSKLTNAEFSLLESKDFIDPEDDYDRPVDKKTGKFLTHPKMVFLVLDDLISTDAFSIKRNNILNKLSIKSRHDSDALAPLNLIFISQNLKSIPSIIRRQSDVFVLLKNANKEIIIDAISQEVGSHFSKEELLKHYEYTSKIPYGALIVSIHKKELDENRLRLGWTDRLVYEKDNNYIN
jgi:hypothetical protein